MVLPLPSFTSAAALAVAAVRVPLAEPQTQWGAATRLLTCADRQPYTSWLGSSTTSISTHSPDFPARLLTALLGSPSCAAT
jgi:hypothetical protein